ncbi:MAG: nucleotidyltransferase substrate binding protein [bacterium]|nr:nucleotidyltransferase substrate binding protein [bacterium]
MSQVDYSEFQMSLKRLIEQYKNYLTPNSSRSSLDEEGVAESVIQRFETCYDCLWKVLKRYLGEGLAIPDTPNSPKSIFRLASENNLFETSLGDWTQYDEARINTSHDYDGEKAKACLGLVGNFVEDSKGLYESMTGKSWV